MQMAGGSTPYPPAFFYRTVNPDSFIFFPFTRIKGVSIASFTDHRIRLTRYEKVVYLIPFRFKASATGFPL